jgi:magnesium and cobalt transporter
MPNPVERFKNLFQFLNPQAPQSHADIEKIIETAQQKGVVDAESAEMIEGVFETHELSAADIMVTRGQMIVVERDWTIEQLLKAVVESGHSRYPVIGDNKDEVVGILLAKDLLKFVASGFSDFSIDKVMRPPVYVPETVRLNVLLKSFRRNRNHLALVADEYGGVAGLVTIEDILETIVGSIDDEYDEAEMANIQKQDDRRFLVNGLTTIAAFNEYFSTELSDEDSETIGGLITQTLGKMPRRGDSIKVDDMEFSVQKADSRRVQLLQVTTIRAD